MELFGDRILQGRVVAVTESGEEGGRYAVVHVESLEENVIIPLERVRLSWMARGTLGRE